MPRHVRLVPIKFSHKQYCHFHSGAALMYLWKLKIRNNEILICDNCCEHLTKILYFKHTARQAVRALDLIKEIKQIGSGVRKREKKLTSKRANRSGIYEFDFTQV